MLLMLDADFKSRQGSNETSLSAPSIPFTSEEALVNDFSRNERFKNYDSFGHMLELDAGNGIADIIIYELRADWQKYAELASIRPQWMYPLICLPYRKTFYLDDFASLACVSRKTAKNILRDYTNTGFCKRTDKGWIKLRQPRQPVNRIIAIEAKLRDWKKALTQASRYQDFSHESWVLLDHHYCRAALKNTNQFIKRNIGLASIEKDGKLSVHIMPINKAPKSLYRYWYASNIIVRKSSS